jgi:hypothetical protein
MNGSSFGPTTFSVRAKHGDAWELVKDDGLVQEMFTDEQDAHEAALAAARKWIDEQAGPR